MNLKKFLSVFLASSMLLLFACDSSSEARLEANAITELRKDYPITGRAPANMSMMEPTLDIIFESSESVLVLEIIGNMTHHAEELLTGDDVIDQKMADHGIPGEVVYFVYPVRVIQDEAGIYEEGAEIAIYNNVIFEDVTPILERGDRISIPLQEGHDHSDRVPFSVFGLYYVTANDYVLSAFDEKGGALTGYSLDEYLREVQNYR